MEGMEFRDIPVGVRDNELNSDVEMIPLSDNSYVDSNDDDDCEPMLKSKVDQTDDGLQKSNRWLFIWLSICLTIAISATSAVIVTVRKPTNPTLYVPDMPPVTKSTVVSNEEISSTEVPEVTIDLISPTEVLNEEISKAKGSEDWENDRELEEMIREKMKPKEFQFIVKDVNDTVIPGAENAKLSYMPAKQFAHLHHMKTGGTSMDGVINCGARRLGKVLKEKVVQGKLSECSFNNFQKCMNDESPSCAGRIDKSSVMSYCAPLYAVQKFNWLDADIITVLRDPVDRVWSQFRFMTSHCYRCTPLLDIYKMIDNSTINEFLCPGLGGKSCKSICVPQILNHQSRNLILSYLDDDTESMDAEEKLHEAIENLKTKFTLIGITEELETYRKFVGHTFPWLSENYMDSPMTCKLKHRNASPGNNRCGANGGHWELPAHPDEETRKAIIAHNQVDVKLYEAAKKYFAVQKRVFDSL
uniref:Sulfotransferase domain-containing protein n=2 Tax=Eucampia antarctica TaxID=49252 RepID=A0A7S2R4W6_9STRA|mmetsp:Transcript_16642/g.16066  ORF Transcript_16642/g.16066 Transcript_16642/m.16066 type:complete len:472 (+) Transcript_16642:91-1506(+)